MSSGTGSAWSTRLEPGERWWGGAVADSRHMPYGLRPFRRDLAFHTGRAASMRGANQSAPLLLSSTGRIVWSDRPFAFSIAQGRLEVRGGDVRLSRGGSTLREAFREASARYFPPAGTTPARELFTGPQYNCWIEMPYTPTQEAVLTYVRRLLDEGMPPGVVMIDDSWSPDYGTWRFDPTRFPDPAAMVRRLHDWDCCIMLWVVPFVSPDSAVFRSLEHEGLLLRDGTGETAIRRWWNGYSALLDLTNPAAVAWVRGELDALVETTGVDGFKFDAGDVHDYRADDRTAEPLAEPVDLCEAWARIGTNYPFNEYRACWKMGGQPLAQRLADKPPSWGEDGIGSLIPGLVVQGLGGHPFTCPDMIGGGEIDAMSGAAGIDQEFFVRYAQVAALAPMMQFSLSPARVLDAVHRGAVHGALAVREQLLPLILDLVDQAAVTGEPVVRHMAYHYPGMEDVADQFLLGPDLLVAPALEQGARTRQVRLPDGTWRDDRGELLTGPAVITAATPLDRIPRYSRLPSGRRA